MKVCVPCKSVVKGDLCYLRGMNSKLLRLYERISAVTGLGSGSTGSVDAVSCLAEVPFTKPNYQS